jgi:hypothetical protein
MKTKLIIAGLIVLVLLLAGHILKVNKAQNRLRENLRITELKADIWKDKEGRSHAEIERLQLTNKELREVMPALLDSIKKDFAKVKPKTIKSIVTVTTVVRDTIPFPVSNPLSFLYRDQWNEFKLNQNATLSISIRDSLALVSSGKRSGFLNLKTKYTTEAISYNPKVTLTGIRSIDIIPEERRWGIGVMVGYGVTNKGLSPIVAGGIYYRIF